jgi:lipopolysaccharide transport system permease protein/teichoic acid transport system permease protein
MFYFKSFLEFVLALVSSKSLIWQLTKHDFKQEYLGSYFGIFWAFVNPLITVLVLWFVFEKGFRSQTIQDFPFILWLVCGIFLWQFISNSTSQCMNSVLSNSHLVKKVVFRVSILPLIKINTQILIHIVFLFFIGILFLLYGYYPNWYWLQVPYFLFCAYTFLLGVGWTTSSIIVFFRDLQGFVFILLQFGFWLTPVFWSTKVLASDYILILKLNPVYYLVEGYRDSFINKIWFWQHPLWTLYFWIVNCFIFFLGALIFKRLRPHFSDVL